MKSNLHFINQRAVKAVEIDFIDDIELGKEEVDEDEETKQKIDRIFEDEEEVNQMSQGLKRKYTKLLQLLEKHKKLKDHIYELDAQKDLLVSLLDQRQV